MISTNFLKRDFHDHDAAHPYLQERLNATKGRIREYNKLRPSMLQYHPLEALRYLFSR